MMCQKLDRICRINIQAGMNTCTSGTLPRQLNLPRQQIHLGNKI